MENIMQDIRELWLENVSEKCNWEYNDILSKRLIQLCTVFTRDRRYDRYYVEILQDKLTEKYYSTGELCIGGDDELLDYNPMMFHEISEDTAMNCLNFYNIIREL